MILITLIFTIFYYWIKFSQYLLLLGEGNVLCSYNENTPFLYEPPSYTPLSLKTILYITTVHFTDIL